MGRFAPEREKEGATMSMDEDAVRKLAAEIVIGESLDTLSIEELEKRITLLEGEIARHRDAIAGKQDTKTSAEAFFRK
jgi:uncharacterized small protein (DUF1192 family)